MTKDTITGRCYCGASVIKAEAAPLAVAYCHCSDCRRVSGAPVAAFAAFAEAAVSVVSPDERKVNKAPGVERTFCGQCGSPLTGRYTYLPGQVFVSLGLLDQADRLVPQLHAHDGERLPWLCISDEAERITTSSRVQLSMAAE